MPADFADSLKADEEDRKTDHATLFAAKENEGVATLTATIETNFRQGDLGVEVDSVEGDLAETENSAADDGASSAWEERQKSRVKSPQFARRFLWPCDSTGRCAQRRSCGWLAKAKATTRVDVPTAPRQWRGFFF